MSLIKHYDYREALDHTYIREGHEYLDYPLNSSTAQPDHEVQMISVFISSKVTKKEIIDMMPNLTTIMCRSAGTDHVDVAYAESKNIKVARVPGYGPHVIATHALSLLLYGIRSTEASLTQTRQGIYSYTENTIRDLQGMKVGIIGTGKIGQAIGKLCAAFDTQLIAYDLYPNQTWADQYQCTYVSFDQLITESDIIILSCNASEENRHLINEAVITQMKQGVYLINIARGSLIDEQVLTHADKFAFIGLDAIQDESREGLAKFDTLTNCAITPHIAYLSDSTVKTIREETYHIIN